VNPASAQRRFPRLHRDGTVSYWSYHRQEWVQHAFHVPIEDIQSMDPYDQKRVTKHLGYDSPEPTTSHE
jgi:hypothetical protein